VTESPAQHPVITRARFLDPEDVTVWRDRFGRLCLRLEGEHEYRDIHLTLAFPLSHDNRMLIFRDADLQEIGILDDYRSVDQDSLSVLEEDLEKAYFMPRILRILSAHEEMGLATFEVETDRGPRTIQVKFHHGMRVLSGGRVLINDVDANRYEVPSIANLDARSQALLDEFL